MKHFNTLPMKTIFICYLLFYCVYAHASELMNTPFIQFIETFKNPPKDMSCSNFSGNWTGVCTIKTKDQTFQKNAEMQIFMMDCKNIILNQTAYIIEGTKVVTDSSQYLTKTATTEMNWQDEKSNILGFQINTKLLVFPQKKTLFKQEGIFQLQNQKLIFEQTSQDIQIHCELLK